MIHKDLLRHALRCLDSHVSLSPSALVHCGCLTQHSPSGHDVIEEAPSRADVMLMTKSDGHCRVLKVWARPSLKQLWVDSVNQKQCLSVPCYFVLIPIVLYKPGFDNAVLDLCHTRLALCPNYSLELCYHGQDR